jgi:hypothetical protein
MALVQQFNEEIGGDQMNLIGHDGKEATIHLDGRELLMIMILIQRRRFSFQCDDPTGQALDELLCSAVEMADAARWPG